MVRVEDVEAEAQEAVRRAERAVLAVAGRVRVREVPARHRDVRAHVLRARLSGGRLDRHELDRGTYDRHLANSCEDTGELVSRSGLLGSDKLTLSEKRLDEIGIGGDAVHPLPPAELPVWLQDTVAIEHTSV